MKGTQKREKKERALILSSINGFQLLFICFIPMILVNIVELIL